MMKTFNYLFAFLLGTFLFSSCCQKAPFEAAKIDVKYKNLTQPTEVRILMIDEAFQIMDTVQVEVLSSSNHFTTMLFFNDETSSFILDIIGMEQKDTITDVVISRDKCKNLKDISFQHNGEAKNGSLVEVEM